MLESRLREKLNFHESYLRKQTLQTTTSSLVRHLGSSAKIKGNGRLDFILSGGDWANFGVGLAGSLGASGTNFAAGVDFDSFTGGLVNAGFSSLAGAVTNSLVFGNDSKLLVEKRQQVNQGTKISISGNTGSSTGPHLHYEVRVNSVRVNPIKFDWNAFSKPDWSAKDSLKSLNKK